MDVTYSEEQQALRDAVRDLLADHCTPAHVRAVAAGPTGADLALHRRLADVGVLELPGAVELGIVAEQTGAALLPAPTWSVAAVALPALAACDGEGELSAAARRGDAVPVLVLDGLVPEAHVATHLLVADDGELGVAEAGACAVEVVPTMDATRRLCRVRVTGATTPLGPARPALDAARLTGAVTLAAELVGVAQACLDRAVAHARTREQFGRPIGSYQAVSHRCAEMFVALESARSLTLYAAWAVAEGAADATLAVSAAKAAAGAAAVACAQSAIQVHGGIGFTWESDLHLYLKRAQSGAALLGTPAEHRRRVADLLGV